MHRPAGLQEVESLLEDLETVTDEPPDAIRSRLQQLVPEFREGAGPAANRRDRGLSPA
jgi:hypothetical protein